MTGLEREIVMAAERAVAAAKDRGGGLLDYSDGSLQALEEILADTCDYVPHLDPETVDKIITDFGSYVLEVARRQFGGAYYWYREQPVLAVGEPDYRIALMTWDQVRGRLKGEPAYNLPFLYEGFARRIREAKPGDDVLYV